MPKLKTNRGAAKRFKRTGSGKLRRRRAFGNHILTKKATKRKRRFAQGALVAEADQPSMDRLIPYK
ncbi:50S ribosomal protein L35 [Salinisphaera orenii MK-B5]|uniref:Large ribosomal subunit protein bL35 n=2 Tax=Salinisphaera orenii TaxID=856731 RepID=A0A423PXV8_9GAMM|nr:MULTISPECIES: 50S ribosomal protein L35 [Salinisphaera]ROO30424.1 50S ribosomal protein L35 [Salinisphaera orenii MK-B5]ROO36373.1 50S ribosomal protein L35 [Salinisphaera halophila YIM 95161]